MKGLEKKNNSNGFTLAEMLIVVAIIAVLVAISIPIFNSQLEKSRESTDASSIRNEYSAATAEAQLEGGDAPAAGQEDVSISSTSVNVPAKGPVNKGEFTGHVHFPSDTAVQENVVPATCAEEGSYEEVLYCTGCKYEFSRKTKVIPKLTTHTPVEAAALDPTCTAAGHTSGHKCSVCGETLDGLEEIPAAHKPVEVAALDPTCTTAGHTAGHKCSVCGETLDGLEEIPAAHKPVEVAALDPTCTAPGHTAGHKCSVCGETLDGLEEIPAAHKPAAEPVVDNENAATCVSKGSYDEVICCDVCKQELSRRTVETDINRNNHTGGRTKYWREADEGYTWRLVCDSCGRDIESGFEKTDEKIDPDKDKWDEGPEVIDVGEGGN